MKRTIIAALVITASALTAQTAHADEPTCAAGEEWQGEFGCVAVQLPEETNGRAIDCPDGSVGYMQDGRLDCPAPTAVAPVVEQPAPAPLPSAEVDTTVDVAVPPSATAPVAVTPSLDLAAFLRGLLAQLFGWLFAA